MILLTYFFFRKRIFENNEEQVSLLPDDVIDSSISDIDSVSAVSENVSPPSSDVQGFLSKLGSFCESEIKKVIPKSEILELKKEIQDLRSENTALKEQNAKWEESFSHWDPSMLKSEIAKYTIELKELTDHGGDSLSSNLSSLLLKSMQWSPDDRKLLFDLLKVYYSYLKNFVVFLYLFLGRLSFFGQRPRIPKTHGAHY